MDDYDKLKAMLQHWLEHNDEHADTYVKWAEKPSVLSVGGLPELLNKISTETKKISGFFREAISILEKD
ncbi:MAG: hypothetical protein HQK98_04555 [Nitrospirae bacterium]|nr:hypothetical protein [Nitrospirota bacterium]